MINTIKAAKILGVNSSRIRQMILKGLLPAKKVGRDWVIEEKDLKLVIGRPHPGRPKKLKEES